MPLVVLVQVAATVFNIRAYHIGDFKMFSVSINNL